MIHRVKMPSISYVVARSEPDHIIGCDNRLPWHLKTDLKNFKRITSNHVVVMGRKTFDSIGRPLPNRINIVMSTKTSSASPDVYFADSQASALYLADLFSVQNGFTDIFVIGGGAVYEEFKKIFNKVFLTEVYASDLKGDAFFNYEFDSKNWSLIEEKQYDRSEIDDFPFAIKVFARRDLKRKERARLLSSFLKPDENLKDWELEQLSKINLSGRGPSLLKNIQLEFSAAWKNLIIEE